jgi:uncharacterized damage-inducible protein DinB
MSEVSRLLDQMRRAYDGDAWHGPPLKRLLVGVDAVTADARPVAGAHTIAEIVRHVAFWKGVARRRLAGEVVLPPDDESWPATPAGWPETLALLDRRHAELAEAVAGIDDRRLADEVQSDHGRYSVYVLLHGVVQHDLYHAGQIALLKKPARP